MDNRLQFINSKFFINMFDDISITPDFEKCIEDLDRILNDTRLKYNLAEVMATPLIDASYLANNTSV